MITNEIRIDFLSVPENESFARMAVSAFLLPLNPTLTVIGDVKTAVSEAVTNAIIHGYRSKKGTIRIRATLTDEMLLCVDVIDNGCGIKDLKQAMQPFYTSIEGYERSGMGFTVMESFMDGLEVVSEVDKGTTVRMYKHIAASRVGEKQAQ